MRLILLATAALGAAAPGVAQTLKSNEVLSSIAVRPLSQPNPVLGADGRVHLAYELAVSNSSKLFLTLDKVEAVDPRGASLWSLAGDQLSAMTMLYAGKGSTLSPGGSGLVFMDVSFPAEAKLPPSVAARISATRQGVGDNGKPVAFAAGQMVPATITFTGAATPIGPAARVVAPPLRGAGWVATNGCCGSITPHRGAIITVNGVMHAPERFAIDWVQLTPENRMVNGDYKKLASFPFYGAPVYSVADGVVVNLYDEADEQVPGPNAKGITPANIAGNMLVVDIGGGAYALYAHLQRGSMKAKMGDRIKAGQVLGLLGNTGNSTAPHLHFHLMDGPSPLDANGLPYVFTSFSSTGVLPKGAEDELEEGKAVKVENRLAGKYSNQLPMDNQVVTFAEGS